mmetsp:Transcript_22503/g.56798  ORF Transcript_22503/g.56798 Transcript_22503/m.56798 type:complete len:219 (-) Transcript_22503:961-1617(-)
MRALSGGAPGEGGGEREGTGGRASDRQGKGLDGGRGGEGCRQDPKGDGERLQDMGHPVHAGGDGVAPHHPLQRRVPGRAGPVCGAEALAAEPRGARGLRPDPQEPRGLPPAVLHALLQGHEVPAHCRRRQPLDPPPRHSLPPLRRLLHQAFLQVRRSLQGALHRVRDLHARRGALPRVLHRGREEPQRQGGAAQTGYALGRGGGPSFGEGPRSGGGAH